jgi:ParB/RepB/Spo0J family partition protein
MKRARVTSAVVDKAVDLTDRLLGEAEESAGEVPIRQVALRKLRPNPFGAREEENDAEVQELVASMKAHGFLGHLLARRVGKVYQVACGGRRLRAARLAGLPTVPVALRDLTDEEMLLIYLAENIARRPLSLEEEARGYRRLVEGGYSPERIADLIGVNAQRVRDALQPPSPLPPAKPPPAPPEGGAKQAATVTPQVAATVTPPLALPPQRRAEDKAAPGETRAGKAWPGRPVGASKGYRQ